MNHQISTRRKLSLAFTDARISREGHLLRADGGTLFLDEIGSMPVHLQAKLLRFLETRRFRRVGGTKEIHVDLRIISATNVDLLAAVAHRTFREDLFYRLQVITLHLPPESIDLQNFLSALGRKLVREALERCHGNQIRAAALLGISRDQLRYRLPHL